MVRTIGIIPREINITVVRQFDRPSTQSCTLALPRRDTHILCACYFKIVCGDIYTRYDNVATS